jgi:putative peptidoglycan lipid II flippase
VTIPASVGLFVLQAPIVRVLPGGQFGPSDTLATAGALAALALGLFFFAAIRVIVPAFYALKNTTLPVAAALADASVFALLCALLTGTLGLPGIGLAASASAGVNVVVLILSLRRRAGRLRGREIAASLLRAAAASAAMGGALWWLLRVVSPDGIAGWRGAGLLAALIAVGVLTYWLVAHLLGAPEPAELRRVARRRRG